MTSTLLYHTARSTYILNGLHPFPHTPLLCTYPQPCSGLLAIYIIIDGYTIISHHVGCNQEYDVQPDYICDGMVYISLGIYIE